MISSRYSPARGILTITSLLLFHFLSQWTSVAIAELKVEGKPRWGFDGTIRVEEFNLLNVEVFNNSENPWQGAVWLQPIVGIQKVDVAVIQPDLFIEPYGTRQIQFYAFIPNQTEYELGWGKILGGQLRAEGDIEMDSPKINHKNLTLQLTNGSSSSRGQKVPTYDEAIFPSGADVLRTVDAILLDHVPRWQSPQIQSFRDWLYGGGTLYLIADAGDPLLQFPTVLEELNEPSDAFPVGYGKVIRTSEFSASNVEEQAPPQNYKNLSSSGTIFSLLKAMTTPDHNWPLIYFLAVLYLLVLFPGCWLVGRKKGDFRVTYAIILGTVGLFSVGFHSIGKRGYGEATTINSVAIARPGQPARWIVKQWSNLFITSGGDYLVEHDVDASAISTGQHTEAILGLAMNQPAAAMQTDIPSFSNRTVVHTGTLKTPGFRPEVASLRATPDRLEELVLTLPEGSQWPTFQSMLAIYRGQQYVPSLVNNRLHVTPSATSNVNLLNDAALAYNPYSWGTAKSNSPEELFDKTFWLMIADDLGLFYGEEINGSMPPQNRVRLYLFTEMEAPFFASGEISPQQTGKVLYIFEYATTSSDQSP